MRKILFLNFLSYEFNDEKLSNLFSTIYYYSLKTVEKHNIGKFIKEIYNAEYNRTKNTDPIFDTVSNTTTYSNCYYKIITICLENNYKKLAMNIIKNTNIVN